MWKILCVCARVWAFTVLFPASLCLSVRLSVWAGVPLRLRLLSAVRFALQIDFQ